MEDQPINISCFDINGIYNEEGIVDKGKNFLNFDSPIRILNLYTTENLVQNLKKIETEDNYITRFSFTQKFEKKKMISVNCDVLSNFSVSHQSTFDSNGYIIFCDLGKKTTLELLDKIVNYINENCSIYIKTYIVGVFKDNIDEDKTYDKMREFLNNFELEWDFEYYEMFLGDKNKIQEIQKIHKNANDMNEVFKNIFFEMWKGGKLERYKKNSNFRDGMEDRSLCILI